MRPWAVVNLPSGLIAPLSTSRADALFDNLETFASLGQVGRITFATGQADDAAGGLLLNKRP